MAFSNVELLVTNGPLAIWLTLFLWHAKEFGKAITNILSRATVQAETKMLRNRALVRDLLGVAEAILLVVGVLLIIAISQWSEGTFIQAAVVTIILSVFMMLPIVYLSVVRWTVLEPSTGKPG